MKQEQIDNIYLGRNKTKKRTGVFFYEAMLPAMRAIAKKKYGKSSASLFAFMASHKMLKENGIDFKSLLNKDKNVCITT